MIGERGEKTTVKVKNKSKLESISSKVNKGRKEREKKRTRHKHNTHARSTQTNRTSSLVLSKNSVVSVFVCPIPSPSSLKVSVLWYSSPKTSQTQLRNKKILKRMSRRTQNQNRIINNTDTQKSNRLKKARINSQFGQKRWLRERKNNLWLKLTWKQQSRYTIHEWVWLNQDRIFNAQTCFTFSASLFLSPFFFVI